MTGIVNACNQSSNTTNHQRAKCGFRTNIIISDYRHYSASDYSADNPSQINPMRPRRRDVNFWGKRCHCCHT